MTPLKYTWGAWPSYDDINASAIVGTDQLIIGIEPWFQGIEMRGYVRVLCANQHDTATARYQAFYYAHPPADASAYNNALLINMAHQVNQGEIYTIAWVNPDKSPAKSMTQ
jgi:hypothetical protein